MVTTFYGLDRTDLCGEDTSDGKSYFSDMKNGGSDSFPFAASRCGRESVQVLDQPANGLLGADKLAYVDGQKLIYDGRAVLTDLIDGEKRLVAFGANILVYPDQKYYNTLTGESGAMETVEAVSGRETIYVRGLRDSYSHITGSVFGFENKPPIFIDKDGYITIQVDYAYENGSKATRAPIYTANSSEDSAVPVFRMPVTRANEQGFTRIRIQNGKLEYAAAGKLVKKRYINNLGKWNSHYVLEDITWARFPATYLHVSISASGYLWNGDTPIQVADGKLYLGEPGDLSSVFQSASADDGNNITCTYNWTKSNLPRLDHVCALDNRLWGCRYGKQAGSNTDVNEIYCSALGDFKKWNTFQGISTDPWYAGVAEPGPFTGAVAYGGHPIFFKEDCAYVISGSYPPYTVTVLHIDGVARGAARSICEVDGALYYKSRYAVMRYTSSSIGSVSDRLGRLPDAVPAAAGSFGGKYYLSLAGKVHVYDTKRGMWCTEDDCGAVDFATADGKLYIAAGKEDANGKYPLYEVSGDAEAEADMPWSFTTPRIGYGLPNRKYVSRVLIRLEIGDAALPTVELSRDGGAWEALSCAARVGTDGARTGSITIPIRPRRCESFRIRVSGVGSYKLTGITKYMEESGR
ncbi:MAG: hypothetical protein EGQ82_04945 [Clostridiales bacterium]|nr:hypothetical protein [Clostridiales bacterium]